MLIYYLFCAHDIFRSMEHVQGHYYCHFVFHSYNVIINSVLFITIQF